MDQPEAPPRPAAKAPPKRLLRALPTLTEVVETPAAETAPAATAAVDAQARLVEQILKELEPAIEARVEMQLQRAISELVHEQVQLLLPRIRQKVDAAARKAVAQAVAARLQSGDESQP